MHLRLAWTSQLTPAGCVCCATGACCSGVGAGAEPPPNSILEIPWPITEPAATAPMFDAAVANKPGWDALAAAGGCGAAAEGFPDAGAAALAAPRDCCAGAEVVRGADGRERD